MSCGTMSAMTIWRSEVALRLGALVVCGALLSVACLYVGAGFIRPTYAQGRGAGGRGFSFGPPSGGQLFQTNCATCHTAESADTGGRTAPALSALNALPPERIYQAITSGSMAVHAAALPDKQK